MAKSKIGAVQVVADEGASDGASDGEDLKKQLGPPAPGALHPGQCIVDASELALKQAEKDVMKLVRSLERRLRAASQTGEITEDDLQAMIDAVRALKNKDIAALVKEARTAGATNSAQFQQIESRPTRRR